MNTQEQESKIKPRWYIINTKNGYEDKVKHAILTLANNNNINHLIRELRIVKKAEINPKTKKETIKNFYPGYLFVNAVMNDEIWFLIRNAQGVTGFIGSSGKWTKPIPLTPKEVKRMIEQSEYHEKTKAEYAPSFSVGDEVLIEYGNFANNTGIVKTLNNNTGIASVEIELFGRLMIIEIEYFGIKKK